MAEVGTSLDDDLLVLDAKLKQLKREYDQYLAGHRPREPMLAKGEVQRIIALWSQRPIQNTRQRFQFRTLCSRFHTYRRMWETSQRQIESGTYSRHVFRTDLREQERQPELRAASEDSACRPEGGRRGLYDQLRDARLACGQSTDGLTQSSLDALLARHERRIRDRFGCSEVRFRIAVEKGRAVVKASPVRD